MPFFLSLLLSLVVFVDPSFAQVKPTLDCIKGNRAPLKIVLVPDIHTCDECDAFRTKLSESPPARSAVLIEGRPMQSLFAKVDGWEHPDVHVLAGLIQSWLKIAPVYRRGTDTEKRDLAFHAMITPAATILWAEAAEAIQLKDLGLEQLSGGAISNILSLWKITVRSLVSLSLKNPTRIEMEDFHRAYRVQLEAFEPDMVLGFAAKTSEALIRKAIDKIQATPEISSYYPKGSLDKVLSAIARKLSPVEFQAFQDSHFETYVIVPRDKAALVNLSAKICALKHSVDTYYLNAGVLHIEAIHDGLEAMAREADVSLAVGIDRTSALFSHPSCRVDKTNPMLQSFVRRYFNEK